MGMADMPAVEGPHLSLRRGADLDFGGRSQQPISFAPVGLFENLDEFQIVREGEECPSRQREPNFNIAPLYSIAKRDPTVKTRGKAGTEVRFSSKVVSRVP